MHVGAFKDHHLTNLKNIDDEQVVKLHPKKDSMHDVRDSLMSFMIANAYHDLMNDKKTHEQRWGPKDTTDPEAYNFEFKMANLQEKVEYLIDDLADLMRTSAGRDLHMYLKLLNLPEPLDDHK